MISDQIQTITIPDNKNTKRNNLVTLGWFSLVFAVCSLLCFFWFLKLGKSFIWYSDGLYTHYNFLAYFGEYLRTILYNISHGKFSLPMWDFSFGYGADILTTINARIGDPLNYFAVFVSPENTEILHNVLVILRIYLVGVAFCYYCTKHNRNSLHTVIGAIMYCFCGLIFWAGVRHPYFLNPMIYFPLLLLGAEKVLEKKSPGLFIVMVFLSAIGNFYFFYMLTILTVLFIFVQFIIEKRERFVADLLRTLLRFIVYYVAGVCLASPLFLPNVIAFLNNARKDLKPSESLILYDLKYYLEFIQRWMSQGTEYGDALGFTALSLILCIGIFFVKNKELKPLKILFVILTVFLLMPFFGYALNGFGYVTNRWMFIYAFLVSYISTSALEYLDEIAKNNKLKIIFLTIIILISVISIFNERISNSTMLCSLGILGLSIFVIFDIVPILTKNTKESYVGIAILMLTIFSVVINSEYRFSPFKENYISEYNDYGTAYEKLHVTSASEVEALNDGSFYRIDETDAVLNTSVAQGYNGISFYTSLVDYHIDDFHKMYSINNLTSGTLYNYKGLDRRSYLENLFGTKYFTTKAGDVNIPHNFSLVVDNVNGNSVYKNNNSTNLCYVYDDYVTQEEIELLPVEQRQELLLQTVVLENNLSGYRKADYNVESNSVAYSLKYNDTNLTNDSVSYNSTNSKLFFEFEPQYNCELYIKINNLSYDEGEFNNTNILTSYAEYVEKINNKYKSPVTSFRILVGCETSSQSITHRTDKDRYYAGVHDYYINLGYFEGARSWCSLAFSTTGNYSYDSIEIIAQPVDSIDEYLSELNDYSLNSLRTETNHVCCDLELQEDKILYFSIPYNNGWEAIVDGETVEILCGNYMGIAIPLSSGQHSVVLQYRTPGFIYGVIMFIVAATILLLVKIINSIIILKLKRKKS